MPSPSTAIWAMKGRQTTTASATTTAVRGCSCLSTAGAPAAAWAPQKYPARQTLEASQAVARLHRLNPEYTVFAQQDPAAIDGGVFHNDVIAVSNRHVLFHHQQAFVQQQALLETLREKAARLDIPFVSVEVPQAQVGLNDAVASYLFNSQLLSKPDGKMLIVVPEECRQRENVWHYLSGW
ncbi:N-succinylarginine dihydrolase [Raoultella terrigena]|uniref:N-succinylarginine dihydrolase n=1 Tax=Raoultella terrigena TaxID=577 RepID=A0A3P8JL97_RAOTE|nr:N-succinylarginine dihydrolase [Raoultella terrigena]